MATSNVEGIVTSMMIDGQSATKLVYKKRNTVGVWEPNTTVSLYLVYNMLDVGTSHLDTMWMDPSWFIMYPAILVQRLLDHSMKYFMIKFHLLSYVYKYNIHTRASCIRVSSSTIDQLRYPRNTVSM